jgi:hypothetical protein
MDTACLAVNIDIASYLGDHCFEGRAVLPAVEAVRVVAAAVRDFRLETAISWMTAARFDKFLFLEPGSRQIAAQVDLAVHANGDITAGLLTRSRAPKVAITRVKEHAKLCFPIIKPDAPRPAVQRLSVLEGKCVEIPANVIYRELVPFGPAYHNIRDGVQLAESGALAEIGLPAAGDDVGPAQELGSPFALDAAFHAACVWGQRYAGIVAFPVGFEQRVVTKPTIAGQTCNCRIIPVKKSPDLLVFDIWIYDRNGSLFETVSGVRMRDVSAGRMKPPDWIMPDDQKGVAVAH